MKHAKKIVFIAFLLLAAAGAPAMAGNQLAPESKKDPVILVHGYFGSILGKASVDVYWAYYLTRLKMDGFDVYAIALPDGAISDIKRSADTLNAYIAGALAKTGASKVDLICHSEGGLVSRYYIQNLGGAQYVDDLVTLATPHRGTTVASIGPGEAARQMEVYSDFLRTLNSGDVLKGDIDYTAIFSNNDEMVFPVENGFFRGAVNANVNLLGHGGIMFNEDVYKIAKGAITSDVGGAHRAIPIVIQKNSMTTNSANVSLKISAFNHDYTTADMKQMKVSNDKFLIGAGWENVSDTKPWTLDTSADGLKAVYVQFRNSGNFLAQKESPTYVDYVFLDRTAPTGGVDVTPQTTTVNSVDVKISAEDNSDSFKTLKGWNFMIAFGIEDLGVKEMALSTNADFSGAAWTPAAASAKLNLGAGYGVKTVYLKLRDGAGNESKVYSDTVTVVDPSAPGLALVDEDVRNPVVLVHGYMGSIVGDVSSYINWVYIYEKLKAEGYDVYRITLDDAALQDVKVSAEQLRGFVADALAKTGAKKVDLVCHSEGGLVSRYYIQSLGGAQFVDDLVTFSTPFRGTATAAIGPGEAARQMTTGSDFIKQLSAPGLMPGVEYTALFSNADEIVVPGKNAFLKGAVNVNWNIFGHAGILFSQEPYAAMRTAITKKRVGANIPVKIEAEGMVTNAQSIDVSFTAFNHFDAAAAQTEMTVSLDPLFVGATWGPVAARKTISLAGQKDGMAGVHVKYRRTGGDESPSYIDYIILDRTAPEGSAAVASSDDVNHTVKLSLKATDVSDKYCCLNIANLLTSYGIPGIGLVDMQVSEQADFSGAAWEPFAAEKTVALSSGAGQKTIYARFRDRAGNVSAASTANVYRFDAGQGFMAMETAKEPVVLVHGYGAVVSDVTSYINWAFYVAKLKADGFDPYVIGLGDGALQDVAKSAGELADFVRGVLAKTGASKVDIICHSEGGLVSRYFIQKLGGASYVDDLITISTPHRGTSIAAIAPGDAGRQMEIGSDFLKRLNLNETTPGGVDYSAVFSNDDKTVFPPENAFYDGALNMNTNVYDHATILFNDEVYKWVKNALMLNVGHKEEQLPVHINGDKFVTSQPNVTLTLNYYNHNAPAAAPGQMKVSNRKLLEDAQWQPIANSLNWTLDANGDGLKAVYVKYKSADGTESPAYVDYALLDRTAPTASVLAQPGAAAGDVTLLISAVDNSDAYSRLTLANIRESYGITGAGVKDMMVSNGADFAGAAWEPVSGSKSWKVAADATGAKVYLKFRDAAGNVSGAVSVTVSAAQTQTTTGGAGSPVTAELKLDAGWNLIYIPAGLPSDALSALTSAARDTRQQVFDARDKIFKAAADAITSSGAAMLWINAQSPVSRLITISSGAPAGPLQVALSAGWNIVGAPGFAPVAASTVKVMQGADKITLDDAAKAGLVYASFLEYRQDGYIKTDTLQPLRAYLIRAYKPCILSFE